MRDASCDFFFFSLILFLFSYSGTGRIAKHVFIDGMDDIRHQPGWMISKKYFIITDIHRKSNPSVVEWNEVKRSRSRTVVASAFAIVGLQDIDVTGMAEGRKKRKTNRCGSSLSLLLLPLSAAFLGSLFSPVSSLTLVPFNYLAPLLPPSLRWPQSLAYLLSRRANCMACGHIL